MVAQGFSQGQAEVGGSHAGDKPRAQSGARSGREDHTLDPLLYNTPASPASDVNRGVTSGH